MTSTVPLVARKTITTIQEGSVYKERYVLASPIDLDATVRMDFKDSSGGDIVSVTGTVERDGYYLEWERPYPEVETVPNGAGFYVYVHLPEDPPGAEHMVRYGTVFRRQLSFPDSPATAAANLPRKYEDSFQRPPGSPGGRWKYLVGKPQIVSTGLAGILEFLLSFLFAHYPAYFMRYYVPFSGDTITLSVTALKKGAGKTVIALACSSDASSYLYVMFDGTNNKIDIGQGLGPDISVPANLISEITPVSHTVPATSPGGQYKIRYDDVTKTVGVYNNDYTTEYVSWTDDGNEIPHGKGYRYFGIGGTATASNGGVQIAYIKAQDDV